MKILSTGPRPEDRVSSPDLYALVVRLAAGQDGALRATQGHLAHAAFLDILRQVDPALAQRLHDGRGRRPFTLSPLGGFGHGQNGQLAVRAGQEGWLRVTLLDATLFQTFIHYFLHGPVRAAIRLGRLDFLVSEILSTPGSHPLAGYSSLGHLAGRWADATLSAADTTIAFHFTTPTAFSLKNRPHRQAHVLPDPVLVFGQLATYWDRLCGEESAERVRDYAAEHVVVARHKIQTHMAEFPKSKQVGFTGQVQFKLLDRDNDGLVRHLNRLADLAFYTGLGSKTTMGMGQVRRLAGDES